MSLAQLELPFKMPNILLTSVIPRMFLQHPRILQMASAMHAGASHHHPVQHAPSSTVQHAWSICTAMLLQRWDEASLTPVGKLGHDGCKDTSAPLEALIEAQGHSKFSIGGECDRHENGSVLHAKLSQCLIIFYFQRGKYICNITSNPQTLMNITSYSGKV